MGPKYLIYLSLLAPHPCRNKALGDEQFEKFQTLIEDFGWKIADAVSQSALDGSLGEDEAEEANQEVLGMRCSKEDISYS